MRLFFMVLVLFMPAAAAIAAANDAALSYDTFFKKAADGKPCYGRSYDAGHLSKHPEQNVQSIELDTAKVKTNGEANTAEGFEIGFAFKLKSSPEWYGQAGICKSDGAGFKCSLEGDGGEFKLSPEGAASLKLEVGNYGIALEGNDGFAKLEAQSGDDKVFILDQGAQGCQEAASYFHSARPSMPSSN